jgi:hypothetical protein
MDSDDEYGHFHDKRKHHRHHRKKCKKTDLMEEWTAPKVVRTNSNIYGVKKSATMPSDASVINDILYPQLQAKYSTENPLYSFQSTFSQYNLMSLYDYFEPSTTPGPFYLYLRDIFLYLNYFTREESLSSLNIAMQQVINFMEKDETKEDVANILKNVRLLNDYAGAESDIFAIAMHLQQLRSLYRGVSNTDSSTSEKYKDVVDNLAFADKHVQSQVAFQRLQEISNLLDEEILTVDNVNELAVDKLFTGIEVNVPEISPLSKNIKHEIRRLEKRGVSEAKLLEFVNYIATRNIKKKKAKI